MRHRDRLHTTLTHVALVIVLDLAAIVPVCAANPDRNGDGAGKPRWPFLLGVVLFTVGIIGLICRWHIRRLVQHGERSDRGRERSDMM